MTTVIRPGQRVVHIPGIGVRTSRRAVSSGGAVDWSQWFSSFYLPKGAASLAVSYDDLVGTKTASTGSAPTFVANGWSFNGSSNYLLTGISSGWNAGRGRYDICGMVKISGASWPNTHHRVFGAHYSSGEGLGVGKSFVGAYLNNQRVTSGTPATNGIYAINADGTGYLDGTLIATCSSGGNSTPVNIIVGASLASGGAEYYFNGVIEAIGFKETSTAWTSGELAAAYAAMAAL